MDGLGRLDGRNFLVIGRAGMDLYADPPGTRTEAADLARLGASLLAPGKAAVSVLGPKAALKAADAFQKALFG